MLMRISVIFGTRPEAIKLAPVVVALKKEKRVQCRVCVTAQHREMLDQVLSAFDIVPDDDLAIMHPNQDLASLTARGLEKVDTYLETGAPWTCDHPGGYDDNVDLRSGGIL